MRFQRFYDPGTLHHRLSLQSLTETADGCGGTELTWNSVADLWACLRPVREQRDLIAQQNDEMTTHEIVIRFRSDVASGWRFKLDDRVFRIVTLVDPDERQRYLVCQTEEEGR